MKLPGTAGFGRGETHVGSGASGIAGVRRESHPDRVPIRWPPDRTARRRTLSIRDDSTPSPIHELPVFTLPLLMSLGALAPSQEIAPATLPLASRAFDVAKESARSQATPSALEAKIETGRLALFLPQANDTGGLAQHFVEASGLSVARAMRVAEKGWYLVDLEQALADESEVAQRVADLASRPGVSIASPVLSGARGHFGIPTQEILVRALPGERDRALDVVPDWAQVQVIDFAGLEGALLLSVPLTNGGLVLESARELAATGRFEWVEPRLLFSGEGQGGPNDTLLNDQWAWNNTGQDLGDGFNGLVDFDMNLDQVANFTTGNASTGVLVIDVGVDDNHPDLNWSLGLDLMTTPSGQAGSDQNVCDLHGTWVAGIMSALRNNGEGIAGIVPDSPLLSARNFESLTPTCDGGWTTTVGNTALSLDWGETNGARVSVNSNFYGFTDAALEAKYAETADNGMVHTSSAGNFSSFGATYPSTLDTVISVGGTDNFGTSYSFTAIDERVEFSAPGYNVYTTAVSGTGVAQPNYDIVFGTSFSAPHVAGLAAALLSINPSLNQDDVRRILRAAALDVVSDDVNAFFGKDLVLGYGQPDAPTALDIAAGNRAGLASDGEFVDTWNGVSTDLEIFTYPPVAAGTLYYVLGTTSGTNPGIPFLGDLVPLNFDDYFTQTLNSPNSPTTPGSLGFLDANGRGAMSLNVPAGVLTPIELFMHHAVLILDLVPDIAYATGSSAPRSTAVSNTSVFEASVGLPAAIPDNNSTGITLTLDVSGIGNSISEVNLITELPHPFAGDVRIELTSPAGTTVLIWDADGSNFSGLNGVWGGYFGTFGDITSLNGQDPNGTWTLSVSDNAAIDEGTLESWGLAITSL